MTETVVRRCSLEKMFLEISQNSQENTCKISKNTFFYRTPSVAAFMMTVVRNIVLRKNIVRRNI